MEGEGEGGGWGGETGARRETPTFGDLLDEIDFSSGAMGGELHTYIPALCLFVSNSLTVTLSVHTCTLMG